MLSFTASLIVKKCLSKIMPPVPSPEPGGFV